MRSLSLIAAMAENRVIGRANGLPWHLPADLRRFKRLTTGHAIVMGRKTWDSIGRRPLPNRHSVVITRDPGYRAEGASVAGSLDEALAVAGNGEVFVVGGAEIFALALPRADRILLTLIHAEIDGDVFFPPFDEADWELVSDEPRPADKRHTHAFSFRVYERRR